MKSNKSASPMLHILSCFVLITALCFGYFLSTKKSLENDELFSQVSSIEGLSYTDILTLKIREGNVSPLFYLTQKAFFDGVGFRLPFVWKGDWFVVNLHSQVMMRCLANLFMSLSITLVFYFFARFYSLTVGIYGAAVAFSSYMTLAYWVMARPYALWNLLSTAQVLLFLYLLRGRVYEKRAWILLSATHFLLSLTVTFSVVQIGAVSLLLLFFVENDFKKYFLLTLVPVGLCFGYYFASPKFSFFFTDNALQLINASFPKERLALVFSLGALSIFGILFKGKDSIFQKLKDYRITYLLFILLMLSLTMVLFGVFHFKAHGNKEGFAISNRYFIYLMPIGIVGATLFTAEVWKILVNKFWLKAGFILLIAGLLVFRLNLSWLLARSFYGL